MPHTKHSGGDLIWRPTRLAIYARDGWQCVACGHPAFMQSALVYLVDSVQLGASMPWPPGGAIATRGLTLDHIRPPSRGGSLSSPRNLVTMCRRCNRNKAERSLREWTDAATAARIRAAARRPINRQLGRDLCRVLYPDWTRQHIRRRRP